MISQELPLRDTIRSRLLQQQSLYPQEKLYLHTDRSYYVPGDNIWFSAYLVNAVTHEPMPVSRYVYVELINEDESVVDRLMIRGDNGQYNGNIYLSELVAEGYYTLRAYTRYMENLGENFFFRKHIRIGSLSEKSEEKAPKNKREEQENSLSVSFHPEGGQLLDGVLCRVAFKAIDENGLSVPIEGELKDESGNTITRLESFHLGMGLFSFIPEKGKEYRVACRDDRGEEQEYTLPIAYDDRSALTAYRHNDQLLVGKLHPQGKAFDTDYFLAAQCRGELLFFSKWEENQPYFLFNSGQLPSGVIHFLLFDGKQNAISERLVFNFADDQGSAAFTLDNDKYKIRSRVSARVKIIDPLGNPLKGRFSVAVTDDRDMLPDTAVTILTSLLLTSDLKGYIEYPGYYFDGHDAEKMVALDHLMMTQGWRRYDVAEVVKGNYAQPFILFEQNVNITGRVKRAVTNRPVKQGQMTMVSSVDGSITLAETDDNGYFVFDGLEYPDSTIFFVQSLTGKGSDFVWLTVDNPVYPMANIYPFKALQTREKREDEKVSASTPDSLFLRKIGERMKYDEDMRMIYLQDIEVTATKIKRKISDSPVAHFATISIGNEEMEEMKATATNLSQILVRYPSIKQLPGGAIEIRSASNVAKLDGSSSKSYPYLFIDGMPVGPYSPYLRLEDVVPDSPAANINLADVESVDVFVGPRAAMFGSYGYNGVVYVTTKKGNSDDIGQNESMNSKVISPLGYQKPVAFYSPEYNTEDKRFSITPDLRTTIYWKPDVVTSEDGEADIEFYSADYITTYSIIIEGVSGDGRIIRAMKQVEVE